MTPQIQALIDLYKNDLLSVSLNIVGQTKTQIVRTLVDKFAGILDAVNAPKAISAGAAGVVSKMENLQELAANNPEFVYGEAEINADCDYISKIFGGLSKQYALVATVHTFDDVDQLETIRRLLPPQGIMIVEQEQKSDKYLTLNPADMAEYWGIAHHYAQQKLNKQPKLDKQPKLQPQPAIKFQDEEEQNMWLDADAPAEAKNMDKDEVLKVFNDVLNDIVAKKNKEKGGIAKPEIVKKIKVALGQEEPDPVPVVEDNEPPKPKNPGVVAAYEKMMAVKAAKEAQKEKDRQVQNADRQKEIKAQLAKILLAQKEKEEERKRLIAAEAKKSLEEQKAKVGNLFAIPKEGEFNGFKFNPVMEQDDNDAETIQALENLKKIDASKPKQKELTEAEKKIAEAKKLAEELKLQQLKKQQEEKAKEAAAKIDADKKKKESIAKAAKDAMSLLDNLAGGKSVKVKKVKAIFEE